MNEHVRHIEDAAKEQLFFATTSSSKDAARGVADALRESFDFYAQAVQDFMSLATDLTQTRDPREAWNLQTEFADKQRTALVQQYERYAELSQQMLAATMSPLQAARRTVETAVSR